MENFEYIKLDNDGFATYQQIPAKQEGQNMAMANENSTLRVPVDGESK